MVYRFSEIERGGYTALGTWTSPNTFEIFYQHIGYFAPTQLTLTFDQDRFKVTEISLLGSATNAGEIK